MYQPWKNKQTAMPTHVNGFAFAPPEQNVAEATTAPREPVAVAPPLDESTVDMATAIEMPPVLQQDPADMSAPANGAAAIDTLPVTQDAVESVGQTLDTTPETSAGDMAKWPLPLPWRVHGGQFQFDMPDGSVWTLGFDITLQSVEFLHAFHPDGSPSIDYRAQVKTVTSCLVPARPVEKSE